MSGRRTLNVLEKENNEPEQVMIMMLVVKVRMVVVMVMMAVMAVMVMVKGMVDVFEGRVRG